MESKGRGLLTSAVTYDLPKQCAKFVSENHGTPSKCFTYLQLYHAQSIKTLVNCWSKLLVNIGILVVLLLCVDLALDAVVIVVLRLVDIEPSSPEAQSPKVS